MNSQKAFTFIELIVVVSIIAIISAMGIVGYPIYLKRARDVQRKNDLKQYQVALNSFANSNSMLYPASTTTSSISSFCSSYLTNYIQGCFQDIFNLRDSSFDYNYQAQSGSGGGTTGSAEATKWVLWAKLEVGSKYWVVCSNGKVGEKASTGFIVTGANCPL